jgi:hypothetical protein
MIQDRQSADENPNIIREPFQSNLSPMTWPSVWSLPLISAASFPNSGMHTTLREYRDCGRTR